MGDAQRTGGQIETSTKFGGGKNGGLTAAAAEAHRLDNDTGEGSHAKVPTELKLALQKARNAKGISQKQLATQLNMQPQVVNEYESISFFLSHNLDLLLSLFYRSVTPC